TRSMTSYAKTVSRWSRRADPIAASAPRKMDDGFGDMPGAGWLNASSPGYNGSVAFLSAGSFIRRTSLASCSSPASSSSSDDFEIGSKQLRKFRLIPIGEKVDRTGGVPKRTQLPARLNKTSDRYAGVILQQQTIMLEQEITNVRKMVAIHQI